MHKIEDVCTYIRLFIWRTCLVISDGSKQVFAHYGYKKTCRACDQYKYISQQRDNTSVPAMFCLPVVLFKCCEKLPPYAFTGVGWL